MNQTVNVMNESNVQDKRALLARLPREKASRAKYFPLSFAQQRLWFIDRLTPGSSHYNMPIAVRLDGTLNLAALERTLREIVRRHEVLRTNFVVVDGQPMQVIRPVADPSCLPLIDLSALPRVIRELESKRLVRAESTRPFDLETDSLMRTTVLRLDARQHVALLTFHHIICDGWSMGVFVREVVTLYNAFSQGLESPLAELPLQYADYAVWQREWLHGKVLEQQLGYWKQQLAGAPELLDLPTDRPRPAVQTHRGASVGLVLSQELTAKVRELCRAEGASLFMVLLAVFKVVLARYSGQEDISVGTPIAGRNRVDTEGLIGLFVNMLVMRTEFSDNPPARELLRRVRNVALDAYARPELPFEKLVDELQVERSLSHTPLFQVVFNLHNTGQEVVELPGLTLSAAGESSEVAKFDLMLNLSESGDAINGALEYNTDLFDETTIKRLGVHFKTLLESFVSHPAQRVSQLQMLTGTERQRTLCEWSKGSDETAASESGEACLPDLFEAQVERTPEAIALVFKEQEISYRELNSRANQLARHLRELGVGADARVGLSMERSVEMMVGVLGILKAGGAYVPLDPTFPEQRLGFMLQDAQIEILLTQQRLSDKFPVRTICLDSDWETIAQQSSENLSARVASPDSLAYVIYTSGSTGQPKGVMMSHRSIFNFITWQVANSINIPETRTLQFASLSFDVSVQETFSTWCAGGTLVLIEDQVRRDGIALWRYLADEKIERLFAPFIVLQQLAAVAGVQEETVPAQLREIVTAGEQLQVTAAVTAMFRKLNGCTLYNQYGPTEAHVIVTALKLEGTPSSWPLLPTIGRPIAKAEIYVLDKHGQPTPINVAGELHIGGVSLARGYLNRPGLTAEKFVPNPFTTEPGARLYKTGDLARFTAEGNIELLGRIDHQVKFRGFRVELGEIEAALCAHTAIRKAVTLVREDAPGEKRLVAYVMVHDGQVVTNAELRASLKDRLPEYMIPQVFVMLDSFPLTSSGKVDRRSLPAPDLSRPEQEVAFIEPRTPFEEVLAGIWSDVLRTTRIGINDNFFELGGHSLLATQVVSRIRKAFDVEIPVRAIFEKQTLVMQAVEIEQQMYQGSSLQAAPLVRTSRDIELPLSFAQQRLWFLDRLMPESTLYNMPMAVRLDGVLNLDALERTLCEIVRRHEVLRTSFVIVDGQPVQIIRPEPDEICLPLVDLSALPPVLPEALREVEVRRLVCAEAARPFDLETDSLLRMTVLRLDARRHIALLTLHHIIFDGWSMGLFIREVVTLYNAFSQGLESPLAELPVQYADYAVWQREWLQGEVLEQQITYWKRQLEGAPELLELPTDRPRPAVQTHRGATVGLVLSQELTAKVRELCRAEGVTLFMLLLATFKVLLSRYTGQEDISVGTPIAGRNRVETEGLIGFFVNMLVMRTDLSGNPTARELLRRVRDVALGATAHQELPFEKLVDELQVERSLSHTPLFQVDFSFHNTSQELLELPGLSLSAAGESSGVAKFDLTLHMSESGQAISGVWEYNTDLFDESTIKRLGGHFENLLESFVSDPAQRLSQLQMLTETELERTLCEWSKGTDETVAPETCLQDLFEAQVERTPDAIAVVFDEEEISYRELNSRANQLAHHLQSAGVREESLVGILAERSVEMLVGVLGVLKAGGAYLPLDPSYPQERLSFMLADAGVEVLLTQHHLLESLVSAPFITVCLDSDWEQIAEHSTTNPARRSVAANAAYVIYTSGSTGRPKGVVVPHAGAVNFAHAWLGPLGVQPGMRILQCASLSFDASVGELLVSLLRGATLCVPNPETQMAGDGLYEVLKRQAIELLVATPTALGTISNDGLPSLRTVVTVGEACSTEIAARWSAHDRRLINGYGPTETTVIAIMSGPLDGERQPPIGRPIANLQAYVLDSYMQPVAVGVAGELYLGGVGVTRGYLNRAELTAERFIPHPFSLEPGERLYRSGDLVRYLADGQLEYIGRIDEQVKLRGFRIELGEIATALREQTGVKECVVVALGEGEEKRLVAYVVADDDIHTSELRGELKQRLPDHMIPAAIVLMAELPVTRNGKVDRRALPAPEDVWTEENFVTPRTPVEEILAGIWSDVLLTPRVGVNDDFFELGGHSLLAMQVVSRIREAFGVETEVYAIFEKPTLAMLAAEIEQQVYQGSSLNAPPVVRTSRDIELPLSFAQQRLWFIDRLTPESPLSNMPIAVRLDGVLNLDALARTMREIVRRHEVLRTNFATVEGKPVQVVKPEAYVDEICLPLVDLTLLPAALREAEAKRLARAEAVRPFDLETDALLRMTVLRLDAKQHIALLTLHHIIFDGWSMGVFVKEVGTLYNAFSQGLESPLAELPLQYADYAVWQREWLQGEVLDQQIGYWKQQLEGAPGLLELPVDRPRPAVQTHRGASVGLVLSRELTAKVNELCRAEGASLFMLLLAVFNILLARHSGQEDISVGSPIAGRNRVETEGLIGFFVNMLVMRTDLSDNPSVRELLRRVRNVALGAYAHQELPFEKLVDELQVERSLSHAPLFQAVLSLHNTSQELLELPGLSLSAAGEASGTTKADLLLRLSESGETISGGLEYNIDLFDESTIKRLGDHFKTLLESFVSDPAQRVSELQMLTEAEQQQVLYEWAQADETSAVSECLPDLFEAQVEHARDAIAVVFDDRQISYRELNNRANQLAHYLQSLGVREESLVGILVERSVEMLVGILGVLKAGGAYLPLDPSYPQERLSFMLEDAGVAVLLTQGHLAERFEARSFATFNLDRDWARVAELSTDNPARRSVAANAAYVIYTSGSTGKPKGVVVPHAGAVNLGRAWLSRFGVQPGTRVLQCVSLSFDASVWELLVSVMCGATLCVPKPGTQMAGDALYEVLQQQSIELMVATPTVLATVESEGLPCLRTVAIGGEACTAELAARWSAGRRLINVYGPTEISVIATIAELNGECQPPIGRPIANMQAYVLDKHMQPVAAGVAGELYLGGVGVTRGYLNRADLTAERFVPHPYSEGARLYRTGDVARWRADGELEYLGRMDDQVKLRGFRIELGEIANALREQAGVSECVVVTLGEGEEKRLVAYLVAEQDAVVNAGELREELKQRLPAHMIPSAIVLLAELPLTKNGKLDRRALPAPEEVTSDGETSLVALRTPVEEILVGIWSDVLLTTRIGVNDNFFELGGHSLLAMQVVSRIREAFSVEIQVHAMFVKPTLATLAAEIEQQMYQGGSLQAAPVVRTSRDVELPLSFAQQRLWFIDRLTPASPLYNMPMAVRLTGALNLDALERTLREIVRRHEVLRTNIVTVDGKPVQVIRPEAYVDEIYLPVVDLSARAKALREAEVRRLACAEAVRPFDLETDSLLRATVLRLDARQHIALLTLHHIIFDGWSMGLFVKEVAALYSAFSQGLQSPLAELPVQYADYAVWQREWLQGEVLEQQITYWKQQLEGAPELLELPADRPRPAVQTHRGANVGMVLSPELTAKVRELCRAEGVTLFMLLLATFKVLLSRYTGQEDISVGTPIAGRNRVETEGLIGFFVNTLVMRTDLSGNPTARELLRRVRNVALGAYAHQELPFEKLVDELQVERSLSHTPLFQVLFVLQNAGGKESLELPGLSLSAAGESSGVAKFDLTLSMSESGEAIGGVWEYNTDLFDEATIKRLVGHFKTLLESFVSDPAQRLSELQMLTSAERLRVLYELSGADEATPQTSECLSDLFEAQVERTPEAIALVFDEQEISYQELNSRANQLAHYLQSQGVREESLVGILVERSVEMLVGILGVLKAGAAYLPLDPSYPQERLSFMLADAGVEVLLTQSDWPQIAEQSTDNPRRHCVADNAAYVIYTSGSTGRPKGVVVPHAGAVNCSHAWLSSLDVRPGTRVLQCASLSFDASVGELFVTLLNGGTLCVPKPETQMAGNALYEVLQQQAIELLFITPTALATVKSDGLPCLRTVVAVGEAFPAELAARWSTDGRRFINGYGPTETTVIATLSEPLDGECPPPIGRPVANMQAYVLDEYMQPVAAGVAGELYLGGVGVTRGYLNRAELTATRFVPHPFSREAGARLYRTGDFARHLADGQLEYIGRIDEQVKLRGLRIELTEIESVLRQHDSVREAVVVVRADESGERRIVAYLVSPTSALTTSELRLHAKQFLPEYMVPSAFVQLESLPLTPAGKVDKKSLPAPTNQRPSLNSEYVKPQTETEQSITAVWQELLHLSEVGTQDNFFDLGGNSLLLVQLHARLQEIFGEQLTVIDLFKHSTISALAARLSHEEPTQSEHEVTHFEKRMTGKQLLRQRLEQSKRVA